MSADKLIFNHVSNKLPAYEKRVLLYVQTRDLPSIIVFGHRTSTDKRGEHYYFEGITLSDAKVIGWLEVEFAGFITAGTLAGTTKP